MQAISSDAIHRRVIAADNMMFKMCVAFLLVDEKSIRM